MLHGRQTDTCRSVALSQTATSTAEANDDVKQLLLNRLITVAGTDGNRQTNMGQNITLPRHPVRPGLC